MTWTATARDNVFPYEMNRIDWILIPLGIGMDRIGEGLIDGQTSISRDEIASFRHSDINRFDRCATYAWSPSWDRHSDTFRDMLSVSTALVFLPPVVERDWKSTITTALMFLEAFYVIKGFTALTKGLTARKRPYLFNESLSVDKRHEIAALSWGDAKGSFFSGHAVEAFARAAFISRVFSDYRPGSRWTPVVWGAGMTLASLTAYARIQCGEHYTSDVVTGAAVGMVLGYMLPEIHKKGGTGPVRFSTGLRSVTFSVRF